MSPPRLRAWLAPFLALAGAMVLAGGEKPPSPSGRIWRINVTPPDATVIVEGLVLGRGSITLSELPAGTYRLVAEHPERARAARDVTIGKAASQPVTDDLSLEPGASQPYAEPLEHDILLTAAEKKQRAKPKIARGALKGYSAILLLPVRMNPSLRTVGPDYLEIMERLVPFLAGRKEITRVYAPYTARARHRKAVAGWPPPDESRVLELSLTLVGSPSAQAPGQPWLSFGGDARDRLEFLLTVRKAGEAEPLLTKYFFSPRPGWILGSFGSGGADLLPVYVWNALEDGFK